MDSTLLDQVRHLCRDRASYEHLKAILVQQERVLQISWEEQHVKLMSEQTLDTTASNVLGNILAREKALAQLADAIQRSPSLELVLQVAVQVAQKLLQVDRVAIFRRHLDGRGEFAADAIAAGLISIADMPERQLLLARHMIESMQTEQSLQTVDSISSASFSSHVASLLQQIGISSYAANKIYIGSEAWGTLVAFHGSAYHVWSESDRASLSLVASQIGIAISLANLRQQSQSLTEDLCNLQTELDDLQEKVADIINSESQSLIASPNLANIDDDLECSIPPVFLQDLAEDEYQYIPENNDLGDDDAFVSSTYLDTNSLAQTLDENITEEEDIEEEILESEYLPISQNGLPRLFLIQDPSNLPENDSEHDDIGDKDVYVDKDVVLDVEEDENNKTVLIDIPNADIPDIAELVDKISHQTSINGEDGDSLEIVQEMISNEVESEIEKVEMEKVEMETTILQIIEKEAIANVTTTALSDDETVPSDIEITNLSVFDNVDDDRDPAIELQFIETILSIAGNDQKGVSFLLDVIDSYLEDTPHLVQAINKAIATNDHSRLLQLLNTLRTNSDYVGALPLSSQCRQLESAVRANYMSVYACLSQVAIESQRATKALRIERSRYTE